MVSLLSLLVNSRLGWKCIDNSLKLYGNNYGRKRFCSTGSRCDRKVVLSSFANTNPDRPHPFSQVSLDGLNLTTVESGWLIEISQKARRGNRVTRLGDFLPIGLLLEAHYDLLKAV
jgi:hypothetical protein